MNTVVNRGIGLAIVVALRGVATPELAAQAPRGDTLRLAEAVQVALQANPMLQAARAAAVAASERVGPAGALPDPQLQFNTMNRGCILCDPVQGYTSNVMTQNQEQIMFTIPWPWKLRAAHHAAEHTAAATDADAVLHLTEWREFRDMDPAALSGVVRARHIVDGRNALDPVRWRAAGWTYRALGRP